jgi:hypothetical protein
MKIIIYCLLQLLAIASFAQRKHAATTSEYAKTYETSFKLADGKHAQFK